MRPIWIAALLAVVLGAGGCAGTKPAVNPALDEFERYEQDAAALNPRPPASEALTAARDRRDEARRLLADGQKTQAGVRLDEALIGVRLALAWSRADAAQARADSCRQSVEAAREQWHETMLMLDQTERVAAQTMADVPREEPEAPALPPLPASHLDQAAPPGLDTATLRAAFDEWSAAARAGQVTAADLETRFAGHLAVASNPDRKDEDRARQRLRAGQVLRELECRVIEQRARATCDQSAGLVARFSSGRDKALRATLDLERSMKAGLRDELDKARAEAQERQNSLYESLRKLEGRFATIKQTARGTIVSLADILFDFNKATLRREVEFNLVKIATILEQFPEMQHIAVEGHTDNVGSESYNLELSRKRAQAVRDFLVQQGVTAGRLTVEGYGFSRPVADNSTDDGRQKNRRVDLVINE